MSTLTSEQRESIIQLFQRLTFEEYAIDKAQLDGDQLAEALETYHSPEQKERISKLIIENQRKLLN